MDLSKCAYFIISGLNDTDNDDDDYDKCDIGYEHGFDKNLYNCYHRRWYKRVSMTIYKSVYCNVLNNPL